MPEAEPLFDNLVNLPEYQPSGADFKDNGDNGSDSSDEETFGIPYSLRRATLQFVRVEGMRNELKRRSHGHSSKDKPPAEDPMISQKIARFNLARRRQPISVEEIGLAVDSSIGSYSGA